MAETAIQCEGLTREFGRVRAVDRLTLEIAAGTVFAFLGPNGAGKTTTLRLLIGLLPPSAGRARVLGLDPVKDGAALRSRIGVLQEDHGLYEDLSARDNLAFFARIQRVPGDRREARIRALLEEQGLWERRDERVRSFSKGMKQRLAMARARIADPKVLFLDEPTSGLDPAATRQVRETIRMLAEARDMTVFLNTHNLDEVQRVCDTVGIIKDGRLLAFGGSRELRERGTAAEVRVRTGGVPDPVVERLRNLEGVDGVRVEGATLRVSCRDGLRPPDLARFLVGEGVDIQEIRREEATLEDVFLKIVEEEA